MPVEPTPSPSILPGNGSSVVPNPDNPYSSLIEVSSFAIAAVISVLLLGALLVYSLRYLKVPYSTIPDSWVFLFIGAITAIILDFGSFGPTGDNLQSVVSAIDDSFAEIFFSVLLPPIVFQSGFELNVVELAKSFGGILVFAFLGTLISAAVIGLLLWGISQIPIFVAFSGVQAFLLGTVLSATDTVAVIAIFNKLRVEDDLFGLIFGESIFNDAVAIVLFRELASFEVSGAITAKEVFRGVGLFIANFLGSTVIGVVVGVLNTLLFKYVRLSDNHTGNPAAGGIELEKTLLVLVPYIAYMLAEAFHLSGVVAILFTGIVSGMFTVKNVSNSSKRFVGHLFRMLAHICEALCFCYIGIALPILGSKAMSANGGWQLAFLLIILCLGARAISTFVCTKIVNYSRPASKKVSNEARLVIWMAGLRGGVAFALATAASKVITDPAVAAVVPPVTLCIVVLSMVSISSTIGRVIKKFGLGGDGNEANAAAVATTTGAMASGSISDEEGDGRHHHEHQHQQRQSRARAGDEATRALTAGDIDGGSSSTASSPGRADPDRFKRARELLMNVSPPPAPFPSSSSSSASASTLGHAPSLSSFSSVPNITARVGLLAADNEAAPRHYRKGPLGDGRSGSSSSSSSVTGGAVSRRSSSLSSVELRQALGDAANDAAGSVRDGDVEMTTMMATGAATGHQHRRLSTGGASVPGPDVGSAPSESSGIRRTASAAGRDKLVHLLLRGSGGEGATRSNDKAPLLLASNADSSSSADAAIEVIPATAVNTTPAPSSSSGANTPAPSSSSSGSSAGSGSGTATPVPVPVPPPPGVIALGSAAPAAAAATATTTAAIAGGAGAKLKIPLFPRFPSVNFGNNGANAAGGIGTTNTTTTAAASADPAAAATAAAAAAAAAAAGAAANPSSFGLLFKQAGEKFAAAANQALTRTNSSKRDSLSGGSGGSGGGLPSVFTTYPSSNASALSSSSAGGAGNKESAAVDRFLSAGDDDDDGEELSITFGLPPARTTN